MTPTPPSTLPTTAQADPTETIAEGDGPQPPRAVRAGLGLLAVLAGLYLQIAGLVASGLGQPGGATLIGVGWGLAVVGLLDGLRRAGARALGTVVVATTGIGLCVVLLFAGRGTGGPALDAANHGGHTHAAGVETSALPADVDTTLRTAGTRAALNRLDELVAGGAVAPSALHQLVHELGRRSFDTADRDVATAFGGCDARFDSGCYHGVLQAFVTAQPQQALAELPRLCAGVIVPADAAPLLRFQCVHGLGHGLAVAAPGDPGIPLGQCDALSATDRADCHGGVFMDHVVSTGGNPGYTCDAVAEQYRGQCYLLSSGATLLRNGRNVEAAFVECDAAPRRYVPACYEGMGRDVAGLARGDAAQVSELCGLGSRSHRGWCTAGAAALLVSSSGTGGPALTFCGGTPQVGRSACYEHVGRLLYALHPGDTGRRAQECAAAGPAGLEPCRRGAGVT